MRPRQFTLNPRDVEECASSILQDNIKLKDGGRKCRASVLLHIVVYAAARISSICDACARLKNVPGDDAVRKTLAAGLPPSGVLTGRLNQALLDCVPARVLRRRKRGFRLAIDLTLIPYHGKPFAHQREIYRGEAKSGTTHFHAYATCYLVHRGERFTLALTYVLKGTPLEEVVQQLLEIAKNAGIRPHVVLLDRGFFRASVIRWLQASGIPFLMPMVLRGRKPSHPKGRERDLRLCRREAERNVELHVDRQRRQGVYGKSLPGSHCQQEIATLSNSGLCVWKISPDWRRLGSPDVPAAVWH